MSIGYACINMGNEETKLSSVTLKNATDLNLRIIIKKNLTALKAIINYNIDNNIKLYRISSDIIPFGSHAINKINWQLEFQKDLEEIGNLISSSQMRVSMHPGQYTVLNSNNKEVVTRAVEDLEYHCKFLDALLCDTQSKIILHIGGVYGDKKNSLRRFVVNYQTLSENVKSRLIIENDDTSYNVVDVLSISNELNIPVVFDVFHHQLNLPTKNIPLNDWLSICNETWKTKDGRQKIHYSQQKKGGRRGSHSDFINANEFLKFYDSLDSKMLDIMLEVKDKNLSTMKCKNLTTENLKIKELEEEWARYKYFVLSHSAKIYMSIRELLKEKDNPRTKEFYNLIETAMVTKENVGAEVNAAQHVWGYVSGKVTEQEKKRYNKLLNGYQSGSNNIQALKKHLLKCAKNYDEDYLKQSLYFYLLDYII